MTRVFKPKPFTAGACVEWTHVLDGGTEITRRGIVWDRAPTVSPYTMVAWIVPDIRLPDDLYAAIAVGKRYENTAEWIDGKRIKRERYESSDRINGSLGSMTISARQQAARTRNANGTAVPR